jgi:hypothetical protein
MLAIYTANLEKGKEKEYKEWAAKNLKEYRKNLPRGWKLLGVYGGSVSPPDVCWIYEFDKYADVDRMVEYDNEVVNRVDAENSHFVLPGTSRVTFFREVEEWHVRPPRQPKKK